MVQIPVFAKMESCCCNVRTTVSFVSVVLLILLCLTSSCSSLPHGSRTLEKQNSHRLDKLRLLSKRLALNSRPVRSSASSHFPSDVGTLLVALKERTDYLEIRDQKRRSAVVKRNSAMDDFKESYTLVRQDVIDFVDAFVQRLKPDAPVGLQRARVLPQLLTPNDEGFSGSEEQKKTMVLKYFILKEALAEIFAKCSSQVQDGHQTWFKQQDSLLRYYLVETDIALASVALEGGKPEPVKVMSTGVGGLNPGIRGSIGKDNLTDLAILIETLRSLS